MNLGQIRLDRKRFQIRRNCLRHPAIGLQKITKIAVVFRRRIESDSPIDPVNRDIGATRLIRQHGKEVDCITMIRLRSEDLPAKLLGLLELPGQTMLHGDLHRLIDRDFCHVDDPDAL